MKLPLEKDQRKAISKAAGAGIAAMRARARMTQDEVAEALGVGPEAVSRIERGVVDPGIPRLVELATLFDCGIAELLMGASPRASDQAGMMARDIANLSPKEREAIAGIVRQLATLLRPRGKRQADKG
jgi:transcriptional regulator with XRE-family HTH domain